MIAPYFCLLSAAFLWGTSFVAGKLAFGVADPSLIVLGRFFIASAFWMPVAMKAWHALPKTLRAPLCLLSFLMIPATFLLQFIGLRHTTASSAVIVIGFEPLMVVLVGTVIWRQRMTTANIGFGVTAFVGVLVVMGWPHGARFFGSAMVFISTAVVAVWVHWSKQWMAMLSVAAFTSLTTVLGTVLLIPCALLTANAWNIELAAKGVWAFIYLALGCSLLAGWLWNQGIKNVPANAGGLFLAAEPIFGVIFAALLLQEMLSKSILIGAALVILPVIISSGLSLRSASQKSC